MTYLFIFMFEIGARSSAILSYFDVLSVMKYDGLLFELLPMAQGWLLPGPWVPPKRSLLA